MAHKRRNANFQRKHPSAAFVTSTCRISNRMGNLVCPDGNQCCTNLYVCAISGAQQGVESLYHAACCEFLLESHFLQRSGIRVCVHLAAPAMDIGFMDDPRLPKCRFHSGQASDPISALVNIRRLSKPRCVVSKSIVIITKALAKASAFVIRVHFIQVFVKIA